MIEFTRSFKTTDSQVFPTLEAAQMHELSLLMPEQLTQGVKPGVEIGTLILKNKDRVIDILTTTASSRPRARRANGGVKKRKAAASLVTQAP